MATGDITESWTRDSAVQLGAIIPRMQQWPALRVLLEGAVRTQVMHWMPTTLPTGCQSEAVTTMPLLSRVAGIFHRTRPLGQRLQLQVVCASLAAVLVCSGGCSARHLQSRMPSETLAAFCCRRDPASYTSHERTLGRGGWVGTRNYELVRMDAGERCMSYRAGCVASCWMQFEPHRPCHFLQDSGAYFLQMLWNVYSTPGYARSQVHREI